MELLWIKGIQKVLDFKAVIWSLMTGAAMKGRLTDGINIDIGVKGVVPFLFLPVLVLLIWLIEFIRKTLMKTERTFYMALMQSGFFALLASILSMLFSYKKTYTSEQTEAAWDIVSNILSQITETESEKASIIFSAGPDITAVFFTVFFLTMLTLLLLPGLKAEHTIWQEIRKTVTAFLGIVLMITVVPGMVTAIIVLTKLSGINILGGIFLFLFFTGMFAASIFTGNAEWFQVGVNGFGESAMIDIKNTWTKGVFSFENAVYSGDKATNSASLPIGVLHICLIIIAVIAVLYLALKVWETLSCNWTIAATLSVVMGMGCSVCMIMLQKLFFFGGEIDYNIATAYYYLGKDSVILNFLKGTLVVAALCMAAYIIWNVISAQISPYLKLKKEWICLAHAYAVCALVHLLFQE